MWLDGAFLVPEDAGAVDGPTHLEHTNHNAFVDVEFALFWHSAEASHTDFHAAFNLNLWRNWMPPEIESLLFNKPLGKTAALQLALGVLMPEYLLKEGRYKNLNTFSLTGLPRPEDDKYASQMQWSDPVYSVWGEVA
jgi:hypothetical protein